MVLEIIKNERLSQAERFKFWQNIHQSATCWIFGNTDANGYGYYQWKRFKTRVPAHSVMCREFYGEWAPAGARICPEHKSCVNPFHLIDTESTSISTTFASRPPNSRLTPEQVVSIRAEYGQGKGVTQKELALKYGVAQGVISNIVRRKRWAAVG
jgi:hypothetical protein